ncbi:MAG: site-2 protease family protein [Leptolyngbyaceae cyanobacterium bins.59]|nr:site-2 protease family protein [Leptolyngbyaceae cyanobacterium bins.59]
MTLVLLLLLGLLTYYIVQRSVAGITRTPVWILWLVMMAPTFLWSIWDLVYGQSKQMPLELMVGTFVVCLPLYWFLVQWGRRPGSTPPVESSNGQAAQKVGTGTAPLQEAGAPGAEKASIPRPIDKEEEAILQNCFPWSVYYLQNIDYRPQAVICRGQLRSQPNVAYETVKENVKTHFGDRFLLIFQEGLNGKPFFVLLPNLQAQLADREGDKPLTRPGLALFLFFLTLITTTLVGLEIAGVLVDFSDGFFQTLASKPNLLNSALAYSLSLVAILGIHELGHYLTARHYQLRTTLPYFIPIPFFLGTFGAFIQVRSPIPNRKVLFDVGISGPLTGLIVTIPILLWGLAHSTVVPMPAASEMLDFNPLNPQSFFLLTILSKLALGSQLTATSAIQLHPAAIAGCLGLVVTALNLMPVGQLDGGHIVHAMFGQRIGVVIGQIARILVLFLSLIQPRLLPWAVLLFFMPIVDEPALNDVSELDNRRDFLGLLALALLLMIILPTPAIVARAIL